MRKRLSLVGALGTALILGFLFGSPPLLGQQPPTVYEDFTPSREYGEARLLAARGDSGQAVLQFKQIAAQNPRTTLGACSLFMAAYLSSGEQTQARDLYFRIIAEYPGSRFEITARRALLNLQFGADETLRWLEAVDQLGQSYGGPALRDILQGNDRRSLTARFRGLSTERQLGLMGLYEAQHGALAKLKRWDDALSLAVFSRETFWTLRVRPSVAVGTMLSDLMLKKDVAGLFDPHRVDPTIKILSTKPNQSKGPLPKIQVETTVRDFTHAQVQLEDVQLTLDNQDVTSQLVVRSTVNPSLQTAPGSVFEHLRLTYRPVQPLSRGAHTVSLVVPTEDYSGSGPGIARLVWTFTVDRDRDDPEDSRDP